MQTESKITPVLPADLFFLLDPDQKNAVELSATGEHTWVYGSDHTKRLQVMAHMILQRVFEGGTVLVCAGKETEDQIMEIMDTVGLDTAYFHLRQAITKQAMAALQVSRKKQIKDETEAAIQLALEQYTRWYEKLNSSYSATNRELFGELTWQQLAEKAATGPDPAYKGLLAAAMSASEMELSLKEYWHIRGRIKTFQRLRVLRTPSFDKLNLLSEALFSEADETGLRDNIEQHLENILFNGRELLARVGSVIHDYRRDVSGKHHEVLHALRCEIERLEELLESGIARHGNSFIVESTFNDLTGKIKRSLSKRHQDVGTARQTVLQNYQDLITQLSESMFNGKRVDDWKASVNLENMSAQLEEIKSYLTDKARAIDADALTHKRRLNAHNISAHHILQKSIVQLEQEIEHFVAWVNDQKLFKSTIEVNALSLEKRGKVIQQTVHDCARLIEAMVDFEAYYLWVNFWKQLPPHIQTLLESLDILDVSVQTDAFDAWYFENVLDQVPESHMVTEDLPAEMRKQKLRDIRAIAAHQMKTALQNKRFKTLRHVKSTAKSLIAGLQNSRNNTVTDELHILPAQSLSNLFPVVFCTPGQLRDYGYYFDTLLVADGNGGDLQAYQAQSHQCVIVTRSIPSGVHNLTKGLQIARLSVTSMARKFKWNDLPASDKLHLLNSMASQFTPFIKQIRIYNARNIQIFSLLGEITDHYILKGLGEPYKIVGDPISLNTKHITESLLDSTKPIAILTRDSIMHFDEGADLFWQEHTLNKIAETGILHVNTRSIDLKKNGISSLQKVVDALQTHKKNIGGKSETAATA